MKFSSLVLYLEKNIIKKYQQNNFHKHTFCIFQEVAFSCIVDLKLNYTSKSGSRYYFVKDGVYRASNHWGRAANCKWRLQVNSTTKNPNSNRIKIGFAKWTDFYPDNDFEKLYFIEADFENGSVHFFHKQSENYTQNTILRTAPETVKLIKQIRNLFDETAWAKYLNEENIEILRKEIITQLIESNSTFQEIRKQYL